MVSSTPRPHFTPGKDPVPILQEAGWAPGPVWMGGKSRLHRDSIPGRPARIRLLLVMQSPPFPRYLVPPRSKYSPQHHVLNHPQRGKLAFCITDINFDIIHTALILKERHHQIGHRCLVLPVEPHVENL